MSNTFKSILAFATIVIGFTIGASVLGGTTTKTTNSAYAKNKDQAPEFVTVPKSDKVVFLDAEVFADSVELVIHELEEARLSGIKHVYLIITSPGGSVIAGGRLIAYLDSTPLTVDTVCQTICASMAAHIHQVGKTRYMVDRSVLMFHRASGGSQGTLEQMEAEISMFKRYVDRFDEYAANRAGIPFAQFKEVTGRDLWISSKEAAELKLTDKIAFFTFNSKGTEQFSVKEQLKKLNIATPKEVLEGIQPALRGLK